MDLSWLLYNQTEQENHNLRKQANIDTNWKYRKFIQNHSDDILKHNFIQSCNKTNANINYNSKPIGNNAPYLYKGLDYNTKPKGFNESDIKNSFIKKKYLLENLYAPNFKVNKIN